MNYTAIGDSVNLASRLEGANKFYGTTVIASHEVYRKAHNTFFFRPLDIVAVKGKTEGIKIYELLGEQEPDSPLYPESEVLLLNELTREAFEVYLDGEWEKALKLYKQIHKKFPDDKVALIYIERCTNYMKTPPGDEWRGVFHLTSK
jgi:adenylate cyclase